MRLFLILPPILAACQLGLSAAEWNPPPPPADEFDWIRLKSGEWLKGTVKSYVDNEVVFDSDVLGLLTIDDEDVTFLRTANPVRLGFETEERQGELLLDRKGLEVAEEKVELKNGRVTRRDDGGFITTTDRLVTLAEGSGSEWDNWSGKISAGANLREGNTQQVDYNAKVDLQRLTARSRVDLDYLGNYGKADGTEFANNHRVDANWDRYLNRSLFVRPLQASWYRDPFQNIAHRVQLGAGIGYDLVDSSETSWTLAAGPAWQFTSYDTVAAGSSGETSSFGGFLSSEFTTEINDHIDFTSLYRTVVTSRDAGLYGHQFENALSFEITDDLDFDVSLIWDHIQEPERRSDGTLPKRDDFRLMFLLGLEL